MLHCTGLGGTAVFFHDGFDIIAVECAAPSGTAISVKHGLP